MDDHLNHRLRLKHLEFVQNTIGRMANTSATVKNYALVLTAALFGFAAAADAVRAIVLLLPLLIVFALLDAQYLRLERGYRKQYDFLRRFDASEQVDFEISPIFSGDTKFLTVLASWSVAAFYGTLFVVAFVVLLIL